MGSDYNCFQMVVFMLVFGKMIELMVLGDFVLKMELIMKEFITKI